MALEDKKKDQPKPRDEVRSGPADRRGVNTVSTTSYVPARILWPALGFPGVVHPVGRTAPNNPTNQIHLLLLSSSDHLSAKDVSAHLRYVRWNARRERYSTGVVGTNGFAERDIHVKAVAPGPHDKLAEQVGFGNGWIVANLAVFVRSFFTKQGLRHLYAITISEEASAALTAGALYNLYWISANKNAKPTDISDEMRMLIDGYAKVHGGKEPGRADFVVPLGDRRNAFHAMLNEYEYDYGEPQTPYFRTEVLHPLFVRNPGETIRLAHLTDVHCDTRHQVYARNLAKDPSVKDFNNWNETFSELYQEAQRSDAILLTGDLIEYGRGHMENHFTLGQNDGYWRDRNWFLFYKLLAAGDTRYSTPVYTTLGNHDWRVNPYGPTAPGAPSPSDFNLVNQDQIKTAWGPDYGAVGLTVLGQDDAEFQAIKTTVESVAWYLLLINPFLDYVAQHPAPLEPTSREPRRFSFLMLDWAKDEETLKKSDVPGLGWLLGRFQLFSTYEKLVEESAPAGGLFISRGAPWAKNALTDLQKELSWWFLNQQRTAKVVTAHWGVISPRPSWPQDSMLEGLIDPCPICNGAGFKDEAVSPRATERVECPCVKAFQQTPGRRTRHPIVVLGNPGGLSEADLFRVQPRWGSFVSNRDWFIQALMESDVAIVLCGHNHRNSAFYIRQRDAAGDGRRPHEAFLKGAKAGAGIAMAVPANRLEKFSLEGLAGKSEQRPLFVNSVCGGPHATDRINAGTVIPGAPANVNKGKKRGKVQVAPGFRTVELRPNGEVASVKVVSSTRLPMANNPAIDTIS